MPVSEGTVTTVLTPTETQIENLNLPAILVGTISASDEDRLIEVYQSGSDTLCDFIFVLGGDTTWSYSLASSHDGCHFEVGDEIRFADFEVELGTAIWNNGRITQVELSSEP